MGNIYAIEVNYVDSSGHVEHENCLNFSFSNVIFISRVLFWYVYFYWRLVG